MEVVVNNRKVLMERPDIVFWRHRYLIEMRCHRKAGRPIVYIDKIWVDSNLTFKKCWQDDTVLGATANVNSKNRLIVVHAGSSTGFLTGALLSSVKRIIKERNVTGDLSLDNLKSLLQTAITEVTSAEWAAHCKHVEKLENNYWEKDGLLEDLVDELSFQIDTNDDSDSEETETCESDLEDFEMLE
ncbi:hypothetical protein HNY73_015588 [Argiope bruennichi]|uniref:Uncharacterized protein n=1 Tax=Argiope bruennichi TaxID=94029 RepID=A0A8T0EU06_ARGBR|nr:hypothetical protein HNY73_015588 [Argiope bruennichi]